MKRLPVGLAVLGLFFAPLVMPNAIAAAAVPIQQNRDEPGRVPYQFHSVIPSNCAPYDCTIRFPTITGKARIVIEQVSCSITTPSAYPPTLMFLWGRAADVYLRSYLPVNYQANFNGSNFYVIDSQVLFYFNQGDTPKIDVYRGGGPTTPPQGDCAISGYFVLLP